MALTAPNKDPAAAASATVLRNRLLARARLRHMQLLVQMADLGSMRKAAEQMGLTQPAATHLLADLEALLECTLFHRHARGLRPTPVGQALLPVARTMLQAVTQGAEQVSAMNQRATGVVRVAAIGGAVSGLLVRAIPAFGQAHPDILVHVQEVDPVQLGGMIAAQAVDVALGRAPEVLPQGWAFEPLMGDEFVVVSGPRHPLARRKRITLQDLTAHTWLTLPVSTAARQAFEQLFAGETAPSLRQISARVPALLWAMLTHEPLLTLVPASVARQYVDAGLLCRLPLPRRLPFADLGLLYPQTGWGLAAQTLAHYLREFARR